MTSMVDGLIVVAMIGWLLYGESLLRIQRMRKQIVVMSEEIQSLKKKHDENEQKIADLKRDVKILRSSLAQLLNGIKKMDKNFNVDLTEFESEEEV